MATPFADTPKWFDTNYYLDQKVAQMQLADPKGNWDRAAVINNFAEAGIDNPYDHYKAFGDIESLSANPLFNNAEYLAAKAALNGPTWTVEMVAKDIADHDLTLMEHYIQFGGKYENLSPSSVFNQDKYFDAKLDMMQTAEPDKGWTLEKVKAEFAANNISALEHYLTYGKVEGLDKYDYSVNGDPIPHPGNTKIVLTTGADVATKDATVAELKTTDRDDVISALVGTSSQTTLNPADVIDGGAGVDTLVVDMQSNFTSGFKNGGSVKNVEKIVLENAGSRSFEAKGIEKAQVYVVDGGDKNTTTIKNVDSADTDYILTKETGKFEVTIQDAALTGKTDNVDVTLSNVGLDKAADKRVTIEVKSASTGVLESLTLIADGKDSFVEVAAGQETLVVEGAGNVDVKASANLKTFNASDADGKVTADLKVAATSLKTVTGGSADDTITVGAPEVGATFTGGTGNDKLVFDALANNTSVKNTISEFETITFKDGATSLASTIAFNVTNVSGVDTIQYTGADKADDILNITGASNWSEMTIAVDTEIGVGTGEISYDGKGVLNLSLYGDGTASATVNKVTADRVETLNISNTSDGDVVIKTLVARSAVDMNVNTGNHLVQITDNSAGTYTNLKTITVAGAGDAELKFTTGAKVLETIDTGSLTGDFRLDLDGATSLSKGVTVNMGDNGSTSLKGTTLSDTFNLGEGSEKVFLTDTATDTINEMGVTDKIAGTSATLVTNDTRASGGMIFAESAGLKLDNLTDNAGVDKFITDSVLVTKTGALKLSATDVLFFAIDNGNDIGIYKAAVGAAVSVGSGAATGTFADGGIKLMGIITDTDLSALSITNFSVN